MSLGDKVIVLIDVGQARPREEVLEVGSVGGTLRIVPGDTSLTIEELTRGGAARRRVIVNIARLVAVIEEPRR